MSTRKGINGKSRLVRLAVLALCVATAASGQFSNGNHGQAFGQGKLEPTLEVLNGSNVDPNSMTATAEDSLGYGSLGSNPGLIVGAAGAWFYPPYWPGEPSGRMH